jgi:hypothetical protein
MKIPITNKGDVNAADSVSFAILNNEMMLTLNTYESFALLNRREAEQIGEMLMYYARTGRMLRPLG